MGRKRASPTTCLVCGDKASGINYGSASCNSCKSFFRRVTRNSDKVPDCPFNNCCKMTPVFRRFCGRCRLKRCFEVGMKKEWVYSEEERAILKERVQQNKAKRKQYEEEYMRQMNSETMKCSNESQQNLDVSTFCSASTYSASSSSACSISEYSVSDQPPAVDYLESIGSYFESFDPNSTSTNYFDSSTELDLTLDPQLDSYCNELLQNSDTIDQIDLSAIEYLDENSLLENPKANPDVLLDFEPQLNFDSLSSIFNPTSGSLPGFPANSLLQQEELLIQELSSTCTILQNNYKRLQYVENDPYSSGRILQYTFYRIIRWCKRLSAFSCLSRADQAQLLRCNLLKVFCLRGILAYNEKRAAWNLIDDANQVGVLCRVEILRPYCASELNFQRHLKLPKMFDDEWKSDSVIFDLMTAVLLFMPGPGFGDDERIRAKHNQFFRLTLRYLEVTKPTINEANAHFRQLLDAIEEMFAIHSDMINFFRHYKYRSVAPCSNREFYEALVSGSGLQNNHICEPSISEITKEGEERGGSVLEDILDSW